MNKAKTLFKYAGLFFLMACGVKGDPVPPGIPADLGRGQPTYKRAAEDIEINSVPPIRPQKQDTEETDEEDE